MNSFAKKFLGAGAVLQLAVLAWSAPAAMSLGNLPLWFEAGHNGNNVPAQFVAHGRDSEILLSAAGVQFTFRKPDHSMVTTRMEFVGANSAADISGDAELTGKVNYLVGGDSARWQSGISTFAQVRANQIYPGVNVVYYGNQQRLEYDFDLAPGVNPEAIALRFAGADKVSVNGHGELLVTLAGRAIVQHPPVAYQTSGGARQEISVRYKMLDAHTVAFSVGRHDARLPLVIDPVLSYATFFGGNSTDVAWAVALGNDNSVYIAGSTLSTKISDSQPFATPGAFQTAFKGGADQGDAFIAKFHDPGTNADAVGHLSTNLIYCTYLGGSGEDIAKALAVDSAGHAFVGGATTSTDFPVKNPLVYQNFDGSHITGKFDSTVNAYPSDAFITELETNGASLVYSTFFGGSGYDTVFGLALDVDDNVYITGYAYSTNFPVTPNAYQTNYAFLNTQFYAYGNAFVSEIASNGATLNYSSYLGGKNVDTGYAISVNGGYVTVVGSTTSTNFPTTNFINQPFVQLPFFATNKVNSVKVVTTNYFNGGRLDGATNKVSLSMANSDAFVASFIVAGTNWTPRYITLLGGTNDDVAYGVATDPAGNAYVVGGSDSRNFLNTTNGVLISSFMRTNTSGSVVTNAFLTQITWDAGNTNARVGYSQMFGGGGGDTAEGVALDASGNIFIVGSTRSSKFPVTTNSLIGSLTGTNNGGNDAFITAVKSDFSQLLYSTYFGGTSGDFGHAIAVDADGNVYIAGQTRSGSSFPTFNAWQTTPPDQNNAFLAKIWLNTAALPALATSRSGNNVSVSWQPVPFAQLTTNDLRLASSTDLLVTNWTVQTQTPTFNSTNGYTYKFGLTNQIRFFRLQKR